MFPSEMDVLDTRPAPGIDIRKNVLDWNPASSETLLFEQPAGVIPKINDVAVEVPLSKSIENSGSMR